MSDLKHRIAEAKSHLSQALSALEDIDLTRPDFQVAMTAAMQAMQASHELSRIVGMVDVMTAKPQPPENPLPGKHF